MDGRLEAVYRAVVGKRLAAVEVPAGGSNQHEINGLSALIELLGGDDRNQEQCRWARVDDDGGRWTESWFTFYDARRAHPTRSEYRLYYPADLDVMNEARVSDPCWVALGPDGMVRFIVADQFSSAAVRLDHLFGTCLMSAAPAFGRSQRFEDGTVDDANSTLLDADEMELLAFLGVPMVTTEPSLVELAIDRFGPAGKLPTSKALASFVRDHLGLDVRDGVDDVFMRWNLATDEAFFGLERYVLQAELDGHFANQPSIDIDLFFSVAKSKTNSRFSRAGSTFEQHLEAAFQGMAVRYTAQPRELADGSKPDFLLPGRMEYEDDQLVGLVTFLGAKTTARERWRQLAGEASRVTERYFATRDKGITRASIAKMNDNGVHPVLPQPLIDEFYAKDANHIFSIGAFIEEVKAHQDEIDLLVKARR